MKTQPFREKIGNTMLLPLLARARCGEKYPRLFRDPPAGQAAAALGPDPALWRMAEAAAPLYALRQDVLVWAVRRYLKGHPEAVIVNLGCGLDTSFPKADNGRCRWVNLDLPEVIALRERLLPLGEREENLAADALDLSWLRTIGGNGDRYVIAGGVFYYFREEQVRRLLRAMARAFPGGGICFDCESPLAARLSGRVAERAGYPGAVMHFSVRDPEKTFRSWSPDFHRITCLRRLPEAYLDPKNLPLAVRLRLRGGFSAGMLKFAEIRFKKNNGFY